MPHLTSIKFFGDALMVGARTARLTAANVANADTPGYKARGVDFTRALDARLRGDGAVPVQYERNLPVGLDGNNVSVEHESIQSAANAARTRESIAFLKGSTKALITALRPSKQ